MISRKCVHIPSSSFIQFHFFYLLLLLLLLCVQFSKQCCLFNFQHTKKKQKAQLSLEQKNKFGGVEVRGNNKQLFSCTFCLFVYFGVVLSIKEWKLNNLRNYVVDKFPIELWNFPIECTMCGVHFC